jgi:hypothetical protein
MTIPDEASPIGSARRQAALPVLVRDLHRAVLRHFLDTGTAPTLHWVRQAAGGLGLGDSAVTELKAADLVHFDGGVVTVAYPFSGSPTRQQAARSGRCSARTPHSTPAATARRPISPPAVESRARSWTSGPPSRAGGATSGRCLGGPAD